MVVIVFVGFTVGQNCYTFALLPWQPAWHFRVLQELVPGRRLPAQFQLSSLSLMPNVFSAIGPSLPFLGSNQEQQSHIILEES